jgi:hypothetical protein
MKTWILVIIFSNPSPNPFMTTYSGMVVPGFQSKHDCVYALSLISPTRSKSICVQTHYDDKS